MTEPILCDWCDPDPGGRCYADYVLVAGPNEGERICTECWLGHNRFGDCAECAVEPLEGCDP